MNKLNLDMPDYVTRRDTFDALLKPKVPYDDGFYLSWEKPERFTCDCCGFPLIMNPGSYEMCSLCEWEEENYPIDTNYGGDGGVNGSYMLFDSRKNFEKYGCMYSLEKGYTDLERNTSSLVIAAKRKLVSSCLDLVELQKGSHELREAWKKVLQCEIELTNTQQGSQVTYNELYEKLHFRHYPVAICKDNDWGYQATLPDFPSFMADSGLSEEHALAQVKRKIHWHIQSLKQNKMPVPEPKSFQHYQNKEEFIDCTWLTLPINHTGV